MASINLVRGSLINYEVYDDSDGSVRLLGTASVDLPELEFMTSDIKGAGVLGEFSLSILGHVNNMSVTLHWRTIHSDLTELAAPYAHSLTLRGAIQDYSAESGNMVVSPVAIKFRGVPTKATFGKFEPGEQTDSESEFAVDYLKIEVDGEEVLEHDKFNYVFRVNGTDYLGDTRDALGR